MSRLREASSAAARRNAEIPAARLLRRGRGGESISRSRPVAARRGADRGNAIAPAIVLPVYRLRPASAYYRGGRLIQSRRAAFDEARRGIGFQSNNFPKPGPAPLRPQALLPDEGRATRSRSI